MNLLRSLNISQGSHDIHEEDDIDQEKVTVQDKVSFISKRPLK